MCLKSGFKVLLRDVLYLFSMKGEQNEPRECDGEVSGAFTHTFVICPENGDRREPGDLWRLLLRLEECL